MNKAQEMRERMLIAKAEKEARRQAEKLAAEEKKKKDFSLEKIKPFINYLLHEAEIAANNDRECIIVNLSVLNLGGQTFDVRFTDEVRSALIEEGFIVATYIKRERDWTETFDDMMYIDIRWVPEYQDWTK